MSASVFSHSNTSRCADVIHCIPAAIPPDLVAAFRCFFRSFPKSNLIEFRKERLMKSSADSIRLRCIRFCMIYVLQVEMRPGSFHVAGIERILYFYFQEILMIFSLKLGCLCGREAVNALFESAGGVSMVFSECLNEMGEILESTLLGNLFQSIGSRL